MGKAQVSFEYIMVITLMLALFVPFTVVFMDQTKDLEEETSKAQLDIVANNILNYAEELYFAGGFSKRTIKTYLPERVTQFRVDGEGMNAKQLVFTVKNQKGKEIDQVYFSKVPIHMPILAQVKGDAVQNMHTIFIARTTSKEQETYVVLCTNLYQDEKCKNISESKEPEEKKKK